MSKQRVLFRNLSVLLVTALLATTSSAQRDRVRVYVDGDPVQFRNGQPLMMGDRVLVPLRGVFERLGANVNWDPADESITCTKGSRIVWLKIGSSNAEVDGQFVSLDQPPRIVGDSTMVPLRFVSESLGADVHWNESLNSVNIDTANAVQSNQGSNRIRSDRQDNSARQYARQVSLDSGTVIPVRLDQDLSSNGSQQGQRFTATLDTEGARQYAGLPMGTQVVGTVDVAKPKTDSSPGTLGVTYDALRFPSGQEVPIQGTVISLDSKSVVKRGDHFEAKSGAADNNHKSVWVGAAAGAVVAILSKSNLLSTTLIGGALGYLYEQLGLDKKDYRNVTFKSGTQVGVRLDADVVARIGR